MRHQFKVLSMVYHPTITNVASYEKQNKAVFPPNILDLYQIDLDNINNEGCIFLIKSENNVRNCYVTIAELSSNDNIIYLPQTLMQHCFLCHEEVVDVERVFLPKISQITLKPLSNNFFTHVLNPKILLERDIVNNYTVISKNDILTIDGFQLEVDDIQPNENVSTLNSDPEVIFTKIKINRKKRHIKIPVNNKYKAFAGKANRFG